jgi:hypothetical protein
VALGLVVATALVGAFASNASAQFFAFNNPGQDVLIVGFWAVGFGHPGVSTEFSIFADRTDTTFSMPIQIIFLDTDQKVVGRKSDVLTAFQRKHYDAEALLAGQKAQAGFFLVADSNQSSSVLSGAVVIGLDPSGKVDGKANLLLDSTGKAITTAQGLTAHRMVSTTGNQLEAPLGLTTCPDGASGCTSGAGFQTFLLFLNTGTLTTAGTVTSLDQSQPVVVEFFGDNEVFLGDCDFLLTAFDVAIIRPGLDASLGPKLDSCPVDLTPALVGTSKTTARWAASLRSVPQNEVLLGLVATVNVATAGGIEAYTYEMSYSANSTSTVHHRELTRLLLTT